MAGGDPLAAALLMLGCVAVCLISTVFGYLERRRMRRENRAVLQVSRNAQRNAARMVHLIGRLDPTGTLAAEASQIAAGLQRSVMEDPPPDRPKGPAVIHPFLDYQEQWAIQVAQNGYTDDDGSPLDEEEEEEARKTIKRLKAQGYYEESAA